MSAPEDSTSKRPLEKKDSKAIKKDNKETADQTPDDQEQPAKKAKLLEEKPETEGKKEASKDGKEPKEAKPERESETKPAEAETKPAEAEAKPDEAETKPAEEKSEASGPGNRPELSEKDAEGRIRKPTNDDILLGRGKPFQNHPGNQRMLKIVDEHKERYLSEKRDKKRAIVEQVLDIIQKDGARFLKRIDHGEYWKEVESSVSFEKVSHALRSKVRRPEGFEVNQNNSSAPKGPLPILPEGAAQNGGPGAMGAASLYNQQLLQQRGMFPDAASMGLGLMPPFGLMPNMFNPNLMRGLQQAQGGAPGAPGGADFEQLVRSQMMDSLLRQRQQLDEALNDVAGGMRLPPNYK